MLLISILCVPLLVGLLCLIARPRVLLEALNIAGFTATLALGVRLVQAVLANHGATVTEWREFLRADALSAWMVLLISVVSLSTSLYAVHYFRRDLATGTLTARRVREFYVLTPIFASGMLLVVLANNLGVMWAAVEVTALSSVLLVALYNRKTSLEAAWKYVMLGSLGLVLALFGTICAYASAISPTGGETMPSFNWSSLLAMAPQLNPQLITLAFVFVLVGYGTKAGLGAVTDQDEDERECDELGIELRRHRQQARPVEAGHGLAAGWADGGRVGADGAEQRQHQAEAAEHDVFPRGFERGLVIVERHQQHGGQRRDFDRRPHHAEIVGQHHQQHARGEDGREHIELADAPRRQGAGRQVAPEVMHRIERRGQRHHRDEQHHPRAEGVGAQELAPLGHGGTVVRQHGLNQPHAERERGREAGDVERLQQNTRPGN